MARCQFAIMAIVMLLGARAGIAQVASRTGNAPVSAAGLVQKLRGSERWFLDAKSLSMASSLYLERTPEQLEKRTRDIGGLGGSLNTTMTVVPWAKGVTKLAFDQTRLFFSGADSYGRVPGHVDIPDTLRFTVIDGTSIFVGRPEASGFRYSRSAVDSLPEQFVFTGISWPCLSASDSAPSRRVRPNFTALATFELRQFEKLEEIPSEDFTLNGTAMFEGVNCHVIRSPLFGHRIYVSTKDQSLVGIQLRGIPSAKLDAEKAARNALQNQFKIVAADTPNLFEWYLKQPAEVRKRFSTEFQKRLAPLCASAAEICYSDLREVQPGCWMPATTVMRQWAATKTGEPYFYTLLTAHLTDISVNQPLPDSTFSPPTVEGMPVVDTRFGAEVRYPYRKEMTDDEVRQLAKQAPARGARSTAAPVRGAPSGATR